MQTIARKNKVNLSDYPYKRDIEKRILVTQLSSFEISILREIIHHSLTISIESLAEALDVDINKLHQALDKLHWTKLFKKDKHHLVVDKERRKYFESQIEKFDEDFEPNMEYLQSLLNKVPIHALPNWYAIPRSSDHIFKSIVEKYLQSPKVYRQYIEELQFDDPIIPKIIKDVYQAPGFKVEATTLIKKYRLSREQFEEYILLLEYHFICCIKYEQIKGQWHEIVTFFHEWYEYMTFEAETHLKPIQNAQNVKYIADSQEFAFICDMEAILKACNQKKLTLDEAKQVLKRPSAYLDLLFDKIFQLEFLTTKKSVLSLTDASSLWLTKTLPSRSAYLAASAANTLSTISPTQTDLCNIRNIRLIENTLLKKAASQEWFFVEDFLKGFLAPIGEKEPIYLKNKGKKWRYTLPAYSEEEKGFIEAVLKERLFELGIINLGTYRGKPCFCLTSYGRSRLH